MKIGAHGFRDDTAALLVRLVLLLALSVAGCTSVPTKPVASTSERYVNLGLTLKGARIVDNMTEVMHVPPIPNHSITVEDARGSHKVRDLVDLRRYVHISSPQDALKFVRFRTSLSTYYMWQGDSVVEAMNVQMLPGQQTYGMPPDTTQDAGYTSGVFDNWDFKKYKLAPPTVKVSHGQYVVTRWLLDGTGLKLEKVREIVGSDGKYSEVLLGTKAPPDVNKMSESEQRPWRFPCTCDA